VANLRSLLDARPGPGAARGIASAYTVGSLAPDYRTMFAEVTFTR
jgi:hypothetical protein